MTPLTAPSRDEDDLRGALATVELPPPGPDLVAHALTRGRAVRRRRRMVATGVAAVAVAAVTFGMTASGLLGGADRVDSAGQGTTAPPSLTDDASPPPADDLVLTPVKVPGWDGFDTGLPIGTASLVLVPQPYSNGGAAGSVVELTARENPGTDGSTPFVYGSSAVLDAGTADHGSWTQTMVLSGDADPVRTGQVVVYGVLPVGAHHPVATLSDGREVPLGTAPAPELSEPAPAWPVGAPVFAAVIDVPSTAGAALSKPDDVTEVVVGVHAELPDGSTWTSVP